MSDSQKPDAQQRIGRSMLYVGWIIILGLLVYLFGNWEESRINPNRNVETRWIGDFQEVVLKRNPRGHYLLNAQVNGAEITFLVDTGASQLVFTPEQARRARLEPGLTYYVSTANGDIQVESTQVNLLRIGGLELRNIPAAINPHMDGYALLGMSALVSLDWQQTGDELIIRRY